ncbi:Conserved_hypothetical protein [Hexamita inflata]|uniref:Uncharacterized protein n=1 Tax=Hexamita inflata TaxID=28002 RepID=A0AA86Q9B6_9EUKA|nr:Conserved hypothetical protein [Hexamita inflata]
MEYFTRSEIQLEGDFIGIATSFVHVLKRVISASNHNDFGNTPFSVLQHISSASVLNISGLCALTSFRDAERSILQLKQALPTNYQRLFEHSFYCAACNLSTSKFSLVLHSTETLQQTVNTNFCSCGRPLQLIKPAAVIIVKRQMSPFQQNYFNVKQIPNQFNFFKDKITYKLNIIQTRDLTNDVCQTVLAEHKVNLQTNKQVQINGIDVEWVDQMQFYTQINKYSSFATPIQKYFYLKPEFVKEYLEEPTCGVINRMLGEPEFYYYILDNKEFGSFDVTQDDIFMKPEEFETIHKLNQTQLEKQKEHTILAPNVVDNQKQTKPSMNNVPIQQTQNKIYKDITVNFENDKLTQRIGDFEAVDDELMTFKQRLAMLNKLRKSQK